MLTGLPRRRHRFLPLPPTPLATSTVFLKVSISSSQHVVLTRQRPDVLPVPLCSCRCRPSMSAPSSERTVLPLRLLPRRPRTAAPTSSRRSALELRSSRYAAFLSACLLELLGRLRSVATSGSGAARLGLPSGDRRVWADHFFLCATRPLPTRRTSPSRRPLLPRSPLSSSRVPVRPLSRLSSTARLAAFSPPSLRVSPTRPRPSSAFTAVAYLIARICLRLTA